MAMPNKNTAFVTPTVDAGSSNYCEEVEGLFGHSSEP